ncbi:AAA family ATPase [Vagococcus fluvialis]|uniref:AAA family ATPase n=1 Tax=Vagococcus fluvialis TaxID=2738 RepID=UPI000A33AAF8|nr:AAA family ATPase [Vagococcus fluvialis]MBO0420623.1 AAA family ATPase [Vagococcus fluvialis]MBO0436209.1 AAA family ATPase [Vagococcus fluvialis]OTP33481.1 hypothetical protein A5798_000212 [Enterococcus sp. 6C8_DIV0013]
MKRIRIKNLRSLTDTNNIDIKPITVLVGKNSIGKSTFLRTFPLLKQTMVTNRSEPILWYSPELVDFGNFSESVNKKNKNETIDLFYEFDLIIDDFLSAPFYSANIPWDVVIGLRNFNRKNENREVNTKLMISVKEGNISKIEISIFNYNYVISIDDKGKVIKLRVNTTESPIKVVLNQPDKYTSMELIPKIYIPIESSKKGIGVDYSEKMMSYFFKELDKIKGKQIGDKTFRNFMKDITFGTEEDFFRSLMKQINRFPSVQKQYNKLNSNEAEELFSNLYDYYGLGCVNLVILVINNYFSEYFDNCQYIAPIRATAQRNYRSQGLSIETITPQGENVPMLLDSMSDNEKRDWNNWTEERFGIKFIVTKHETNISLKLEKNSEEINLADTGFGYSQLLPILLYAWKTTKHNSKKYFWTSDKRRKINTLVIEQPELHLHPALQANVLDVFIELIKFYSEELEFNIIMETHSETIITRLGQHVAISEGSKLSEKINIVVFNEIGGRLEINQSHFSKEGYLEKWPIDFFLPDLEGILR